MQGRVELGRRAGQRKDWAWEGLWRWWPTLPLNSHPEQASLALLNSGQDLRRPTGALWEVIWDGQMGKLFPSPLGSDGANMEALSYP